MMIKVKFPDTSDAERWLTDNTFIFQGNVYTVTPDCRVVKVKSKKTDSKVVAGKLKE